MAAGRNLFGLSAQAKARLIEKLSSAATRIAPAARPPPRDPGPSARCRPGGSTCRDFEAYREIRMIEEAADYLGIGDPFFRVHQGIAGAETVIGDRPYINFASYNYHRAQRRPAHRRGGEGGDRPLRHLGLGEPPGVRRAADPPRAGAGAGAHSRRRGRVALVGGHSTNVTVIGHLLGRNDLIVHDALIHNSIVQGAMLSGARRVPFRHLDPDAADKALGRHARAPRPRAARHRGPLQHGRRRARPRRLCRGGATAPRLADGRRGACSRRARPARLRLGRPWPASTPARSISGWAR